ncbi:hypothetical protein [Frankia sp. CiP3]|uniref:hypothetical protein n=1 Tax=Frankia sp. CiP3 TaxID=2880971 RepID=UPI001EF66F00|nr:hypothetical protein [Frankia sp. CiP3]
MPRSRLAPMVLLLLVLAACASPATAPGPALTPVPSGASDRVTPAAMSTVYPAHCEPRDHDELPDPVCTPGAINPEVTQASIGRTICMAGWTATIRPPTSYTNRIKQQAVTAYGAYAGTALDSYELDHLISLELGGAPAAVANLWPEQGLHNAKDPVENAAKQAVCAGRLSLADAQHAIATNWITLGHQLGVAGIPTS